MKIRLKITSGLTAVGLTLAATVSTSFAGPVIIDGTDANDHGSFNGSVNLLGWEYMQRALQNLGGQVSNGQTRVVDLGTTSGQARSAINSAFNQSTINGPYSLVHIDGTTDINTYLSGGSVGGVSLANTGILYLPTVQLSSGDATALEMALYNTYASAIASHVSGGGGLFAMGEDGAGAFGWLNTLIPGLIYTDLGGGGIGTNITLTGAGTTAFPGLTNTDLAGADPWHGYFSGSLGSLSSLGEASYLSANRSVIIGGGSGTVITAAPDSSALMAFLPVLAGLLFVGSRQRRKEV